MTKAQKEIEHEIEFYNPRPKIAKGMRELGEMGFEFSGHGTGIGGEDFGLVKDPFYVNLCNTGTKVKGAVYQSNPPDSSELADTGPMFEGTVDQAIKYIRKNS